jgi:hypothetical protein
MRRLCPGDMLLRKAQMSGASWPRSILIIAIDPGEMDERYVSGRRPAGIVAVTDMANVDHFSFYFVTVNYELA